MSTDDLPRVVGLRGPAGITFDVALGATLAQTPSTLLEEARRANGPDELPLRLCIKRGRRPADFGRLDLERVACERLDHPNLARYLGGARTPELGTVLGFERLGANPLGLLNAKGTRPAFRDPGTRCYPLPPGVALELAFDVLLALEHVHERGFVHGGVTLGNLLVRVPPGPDGRDDVLGQVAAGAYHGVLAGLGGARELTFLDALRSGAADPELTPRLPDLVAPPEALLELPQHGGRRLFSQATDMYAFGLLLHQLITGRWPYDHLVSPAELEHREVVAELKLREARGELTPTRSAALRDLPLHDSPFSVSPADAWPTFHGTIRHVLLACTDPVPEKRPPAARLRALFERDLRLEAAVRRDAPRPWVQLLFQWLPASNRLRGDRPFAGLDLSEDEDKLLVVEVKPLGGAVPAAPEPALAASGGDDDFDPGRSLTLRAAPKAKVPPVQRRIPAPTPLREVLRAHMAKEPLPVTAPYLVSSMSLEKADLAKAVVHSLGAAASWVAVQDGAVQDQIRLVVGRVPSCDIVCPDPMVSKRHAAIGFDRASGHWYVEDLKSANGTVVDERSASGDERVKLKKEALQIVLGTAVTLTYLEDEPLRAHLDEVLMVARRGVAAAKAAANDAKSGFLDEAPQGSQVAAEEGLSAPTRKLQRPNFPRPAQFPLTRATTRATSFDGEALLKRLVPHAEEGATFRIVLTGAIVEHADTAQEAVALVRGAGSDLVSLEAVYPRKRIPLFIKST